MGSTLSSVDGWIPVMSCVSPDAPFSSEAVAASAAQHPLPVLATYSSLPCAPLSRAELDSGAVNYIAADTGVPMHLLQMIVRDARLNHTLIVLDGCRMGNVLASPADRDADCLSQFLEAREAIKSALSGGTSGRLRSKRRLLSGKEKTASSVHTYLSLPCAAVMSFFDSNPSRAAVFFREFMRGITGDAYSSSSTGYVTARDLCDFVFSGVLREAIGSDVELAGAVERIRGKRKFLKDIDDGYVSRLKDALSGVALRFSRIDTESMPWIDSIDSSVNSRAGSVFYTETTQRRYSAVEIAVAAAAAVASSSTPDGSQLPTLTRSFTSTVMKPVQGEFLFVRHSYRALMAAAGLGRRRALPTPPVAAAPLRGSQLRVGSTGAALGTSSLTLRNSSGTIPSGSPTLKGALVPGVKPGSPTIRTLSSALKAFSPGSRAGSPSRAGHRFGSGRKVPSPASRMGSPVMRTIGSMVKLASPSPRTSSPSAAHAVALRAASPCTRNASAPSMTKGQVLPSSSAVVHASAAFSALIKRPAPLTVHVLPCSTSPASFEQLVSSTPLEGVNNDTQLMGTFSPTNTDAEVGAEGSESEDFDDLEYDDDVDDVVAEGDDGIGGGSCVDEPSTKDASAAALKLIKAVVKPSRWSVLRRHAGRKVRSANSFECVLMPSQAMMQAPDYVTARRRKWPGDGMSHYNHRIVLAVEQWLSSEFWGQRVLCLHGGVGTGKTTWASDMATVFPSCVCAELYCGPQSCHFRGPAALSAFVRSLSYQLCASVPGFATALTQGLSNSRLQDMLERDNPSQLFRQLIHRPLQQLSRPAVPVFVVVDGVDQVLPDAGADVHSQPLVTFLRRHWACLPVWLGLFVTSFRSRSLVQLHTTYVSLEGLDLRYQVDVFIFHNVKRALATVPSDSTLGADCQPPLNANVPAHVSVGPKAASGFNMRCPLTIARVLSAKAGGSFLTAHLLLDAAIQCNFDSTHLQLMPDTLEQWLGAFRAGQGRCAATESINLVAAVAGLVLTAQQPVSVDFLSACLPGTGVTGTDLRRLLTSPVAALPVASSSHPCPDDIEHVTSEVVSPGPVNDAARDAVGSAWVCPGIEKSISCAASSGTCGVHSALSLFTVAMDGLVCVSHVGYMPLLASLRTPDPITGESYVVDSLRASEPTRHHETLARECLRAMAPNWNWEIEHHGNFDTSEDLSSSQHSGLPLDTEAATAAVAQYPPRVTVQQVLHVFGRARRRSGIPSDQVWFSPPFSVMQYALSHTLTHLRHSHRLDLTVPICTTPSYVQYCFSTRRGTTAAHAVQGYSCCSRH